MGMHSLISVNSLIACSSGIQVDKEIKDFKDLFGVIYILFYSFISEIVT